MAPTREAIAVAYQIRGAGSAGQSVSRLHRHLATPPPRRHRSGRTRDTFEARAGSDQSGRYCRRRGCCCGALPMQMRRRPPSSWRRPTIPPCSVQRTREASRPIPRRRGTGTKRPPSSVRRRRSNASVKCKIHFNALPGDTMQRWLRLAVFAAMMACGLTAACRRSRIRSGQGQREPEGDLSVRLNRHQAGPERQHGHADIRHHRRHLCAVRRRSRLRAR